MSSEGVIKLDNISKCYHVYDGPQERLKQFVLPKIFGLAAKKSRNYFSNFWALKDITFEVSKGEAIGIIGKNGSGKSTLLQIITGTLLQTNGSIKINGKVAALLELGAGFNPEFTGRENVYLNASLFGLSKKQIDGKIEQIINFAGIGEFIDQPVKLYSSGMYVRLAFAVLAHVEADVLIIDEALAVGDAIFTQKCMRFIRDFMQKGTLIFVSHDMNSVLNLCSRAIWLRDGCIEQMGNTKNVVENYLKFTLQETYGEGIQLNPIKTNNSAKKPFVETSPANYNLKKNTSSFYESSLTYENNLFNSKGWKTGGAEITDVSLINVVNKDQSIFEGGETVLLNIKAIFHQDMTSPIFGFLVKDRLGQILFGENTLPFSATNFISASKGSTLSADFVFTLPYLPNGEYVVMVSVADGDLHKNTQHHFLHDALLITVFSSNVRWGLVGVAFAEISMRSL